jgi:hypothetical protein
MVFHPRFIFHEEHEGDPAKKFSLQEKPVE